MLTNRKLLRLPQVATFFGVCVFTWIATGSILAQARSKRTIPDGTTTVLQAVKTVEGSPGGLVKLAIPPYGIGILLTKFNVGVMNGVATVNAGVSMRGRSPGVRYVWRLRVVDAEEQVANGMVYSDQFFEMEKDLEMSPTFSDIILLPPGRSRLELAMFGVKKGEDLSILDDEAKANARSELRGIQVVYN